MNNTSYYRKEDFDALLEYVKERVMGNMDYCDVEIEDVDYNNYSAMFVLFDENNNESDAVFVAPVGDYASEKDYEDDLESIIYQLVLDLTVNPYLCGE